MACTDINIYEDIKHCAGTVNLPGTRNHIFAIKKSEITSWPEKGAASASGATLASVVTITGDFTLASDAKWEKLSLVPDASSFQCDSQGNWGSKTFNNQVTAVMPGTAAEATGFCAMANNDDLVYLVPQRDGKYRLFGSEAFETTVEISQTSGAAASSDSAQTQLTISVTDDTPAPFYEGKIVTNDGTISGKDGKPVTA